MDITTHDKPSQSDPISKDQSDYSTKKSELTSELTESGYHSDNPTERESPSRLAAHYSGAMNTEYNRQLAAGFHLLTDKTGRTSPSSSDESSSSSSDIVHTQTESTAYDALDKTLEIGEDPSVESNTDNSASVEMGPTLSDILDDTVETGKVSQSTSEESIPDMVGHEFRNETKPEISETHIHTVETEKSGTSSSEENISENIVNTGTEPTISDIIDTNVETEISKTSPIQENIPDNIVHTGTAPTISDNTDENVETEITGTSVAEGNNSENIINTETESFSDFTDMNMENEMLSMSPFKENIPDDIVYTGIAPTISDITLQFPSVSASEEIDLDIFINTEAESISDITDMNMENEMLSMSPFKENIPDDIVYTGIAPTISDITLQFPSVSASEEIDLDIFINTEAESISDITDMNMENEMLRMSPFKEFNNSDNIVYNDMEPTISDIADKNEETEISGTSPSEKNELDIIINTETAPAISNITDENVEHDILGTRLTEEKNLDNIVHTESAVSSIADQNVETEITVTSLSEKNQSESEFSDITDKNVEIYGTSPNEENNLNNIVCTETESISDMSDKSVETGISDTRPSQEKSLDNIIHAETEHTISDITENPVEIGMLGTSASEETNSDNIVHSGTDSEISDITEKNVETGIMDASPIEENNSRNITRTQTEFATSDITDDNVEISGTISPSEENILDNIVETETDRTIFEIPVNTVAAENVVEERNSFKIIPTEAEPANIPDIVVETEKSGLKGEDNSDDIVHSDVEPTIYGIPDVIVETEKPGTSHIKGSIPGNSPHTETEPTISNDTVETEKLGQSMENNLENIPQTESQSTISSIPVCAVETEKVGSTPIEESISDNLSGIETAPAFSDISDNIVKTEKSDQRPNEERRVRYRLSANPNLQTSIPDETMQKDFIKTENVDRHLFHSCFSYSGRLQRDLTSDSALLENSAIHPENVETETDDEESFPENSIDVEADTIVSGITDYVYDTEEVIACDENINIHTKAEPTISNIPGNKMETEISDSNVDLSISKMDQGINIDENEAISDVAGETSEVLTAAPSSCMVVNSDPSLCAVVAEAQITVSDMVPDETKEEAILLSSLNAEIENSCKKPDPISPGLQTSVSVETTLEASRKTQKVGEMFSLGVLSIDAPIEEEKDGYKFSAIEEIPLQIETTRFQDGSDSSKPDIPPIEDTVEEQTSKPVETECISVEEKICLLTMEEADIDDGNSKDAIGNSFYTNIPFVMENEELDDGNSKDAIGNSFYTNIPFVMENEELDDGNSKDAIGNSLYTDIPFIIENEELFYMNEIGEKTEKSIVNEVSVSRNADKIEKKTDKSIVSGNADEIGNVDEIGKKKEKSIVNEVLITSTYSVITRVIHCSSDQRTTSQDVPFVMENGELDDGNSKDAIGDSFYTNIPFVMENEELDDGNSKDAIGNSFYTNIPFIIENEELFYMNEIGKKTERSIVNKVSVSRNADKIEKKTDKSIVIGNADESGNVDEIGKKTERSIVNEVFMSRNADDPYKITTTYSVITRYCGSDQRTTSQDEDNELENPASQLYATIPEQTSDRVSVNDGSDPTTVDLSASREHVITEDKETNVCPGDRHLPDGATNEDLVVQSDNLDKSVPEPVKILEVKSTSGLISAERKAMDNCSVEEMLGRELEENATSQKNGIAGVASSESKHLGNGVSIGPDAATLTSEQTIEGTRCSNVKLSNFFDMDEFSDSFVNEIVCMRQGLYPNIKETKKSKEGLRFYEVPSYLKDRMDEKSTKEFYPEDMQEQLHSSLAKMRDMQRFTREEQLMAHTASEASERPFMWRDFSSVINKPSVGKGQFMSFDAFHELLNAKEPKKQLTVKEPKSLPKILIVNDEHVVLPKSGGNKTDVKGCSSQPPGHETLPPRSLYVDSPVTIQILPSEKIRILYPSDKPTTDLMFLTDDEEDDATTGQEGGSTKQPSKKWDVRDDLKSFDGKAEQRDDDEKLQPIGAGLQEARQMGMMGMTDRLKRFEYINNQRQSPPWINLEKKKERRGPVPVAKKEEEEEEYLLLGMIVLIAIILLPVVIIAFDHGYVQLFPDCVYYVLWLAAVVIFANSIFC